ncbi:MAG: DUF4012 domain-containing protein [Actinobacteria bacterium]|nr:DUF4012 domain-containing protein [Actinomycetota bacterium]
MADVGLLGLAVALTLVAGLGIAGYEEFAERRGWRWRNLHRPGGVALLLAAGLTAALAGLVRGNLFVGVALVVAALSSLAVLRRSGRFLSFLMLWVGAIAVVFVLDAEVAAFGVRAADVAFTALLLAAVCSLLREFDAAGAYGWATALGAAGAMTAMCYALDRSGDARLGLLVTGAVFGVISVVPFGAGMLGRTGARFLGLVIGGMAFRAAAGSPGAAIPVLGVALIAAALYVAFLPAPNRRRVALSLGAVAILFGVLAVPATLALLDVARPMSQTVATSRGLVRVDPRGGLETASARLGPLQQAFTHYARRLESRSVQLGRYVPVLGANLRAATVATRAAANLAGSARGLLSNVSVRSVSPRNGAVDRQALRNLNGGLQTVQEVIAESQQRIAAGGNLDLLLPQLRSGVRDLQRQLDSVEGRVTTTIEGTAVAERLLGFDRPRLFFVAMQNNAESRATGGYIANYGIVTMDNGRVASRTFTRTSEFDEARDRPRLLNAPRDFRRRYSQFDVDRNWTNVNLSPDYPTVARIMADQYRQFSGQAVDGVITLDPVALAGLLKLTGPVRVPSWPVPLTERNIVEVTLHDEYVAFENNSAARLDFLGDVAEVVFDRLISQGLNDVLVAAPVIDNLASTRRLQMWSPDAAARGFFAKTGSDGALKRTGDAVVVTTQNAAGNKADYFLERKFSYDSLVAHRDSSLAVQSTLTVQLTNRAPVRGQPRYVVGPAFPGLKAGDNRLYFSFYSPLEVTEATIDGQKLDLSAAPELGVTARSAFVVVPVSGTRTIQIKLAGLLPERASYRLDVFQQPTVVPDALDLRVRGAGQKGRFVFSGPVVQDLHLSLPAGR